MPGPSQRIFAPPYEDYSALSHQEQARMRNHVLDFFLDLAKRPLLAQRMVFRRLLALNCLPSKKEITRYLKDNIEDWTLDKGGHFHADLISDRQSQAKIAPHLPVLIEVYLDWETDHYDYIIEDEYLEEETEIPTPSTSPLNLLWLYEERIQDKYFLSAEGIAVIRNPDPYLVRVGERVTKGQTLISFEGIDGKKIDLVAPFDGIVAEIHLRKLPETWMPYIVFPDYPLIRLSLENKDPQFLPEDLEEILLNPDPQIKKTGVDAILQFPEAYLEVFLSSLRRFYFSHNMNAKILFSDELDTLLEVSINLFENLHQREAREMILKAWTDLLRHFCDMELIFQEMFSSDDAAFYYTEEFVPAYTQLLLGLQQTKSNASVFYFKRHLARALANTGLNRFSLNLRMSWMLFSAAEQKNRKQRLKAASKILRLLASRRSDWMAMDQNFALLQIFEDMKTLRIMTHSASDLGAHLSGMSLEMKQAILTRQKIGAADLLPDDDPILELETRIYKDTPYWLAFMNSGLINNLELENHLAELLRDPSVNNFGIRTFIEKRSLSDQFNRFRNEHAARTSGK